MSPEGRSCVFEYSSQWLMEGFTLSPLELPLKSDLLFSEPDKFDRNFAIFEDSMLRKDGLQLKNLTPLQRLAIVGSSGMGALRYEPHVSLEKTEAKIGEDQLDEVQRRVLEILSEKGEGDESLLY